ncbi:pyridoxal 5'-phosphate synthase [Aureitalea sp. L0-47]|uniref:pyridoxine/pyridoxamine 5'-phosphate oxidase n=1 Tax=Aureitalea sp. L0-47 TaxID=2816962 RepID=UPI0022385C87|nr:pyridoxal 5'-phosphate synthase [Aureitalea sp. L0-47]MCW5520911.1 pyridoxal 5'-phosphate synthase [Aureitalea sp. L0-47]
MKDLEPEEQPHPFLVFTHWFHEYSSKSNSKFTGACVLSTVGEDGLPNARNISIKGLEYPYLIFGSPTSSLKAKEIDANKNVALTFWWEESMRQVRIQGVVSKANDETSNFLFQDRRKEAQVVSLISEQGAELLSWEMLEGRYRIMLEDMKDKEIQRPEHWSGFQIEPFRYEFMEFRKTRLHFRKVFSKKNDGWEMKMIQP